MRDGFEGHWSWRKPERECDFTRLEDGSYASDHVQRHWWTWQCARVEPSHLAEMLLSELKTCRADLARIAGELRESVTAHDGQIVDPEDRSLCDFEDSRVARIDALITEAERILL
jgi:hypothetical protein